MTDLSPPEHQHSPVVDDAGRWLAEQGDMTGRAVVPELRQRFGLTSLESVEAIRAANAVRRRLCDR